MPFPMVHLSIAQAILPFATVEIEVPAFLAGSLAPDSVHFRPNFCAEYKEVSHLTPDGWEWSISNDNAGWVNKVLDFLEENRCSEHRSFLCGYCGHILADAAWNERYWMPYRSRQAAGLEQYNVSELHQDCYEIDTVLYHSQIAQSKLWSVLPRAKGVELEGIVSAQETDRMIESILREQYANRPIREQYEYQYVQIKHVTEFIREQAPKIAQQIFSSL